MTSERNERLWAAARIAVGVVVAYAGFAKLTEPVGNFEAALLRYGVFSPVWIPWIARIIPWVEWILGSFLVVGYAPRATAVSAALLHTGFLVTLTSSKLFVESGGSDCGCFGQGWLRLSLQQIFVVDLIALGVLIRVAMLKEFPLTLHRILVKDKQ